LKIAEEVKRGFVAGRYNILRKDQIKKYRPG
jgi:hypothetical protein